MKDKHRSFAFRAGWLECIGLCVAVFVSAALVWAGGEPWKSKPFQQWDVNDVRKIMTDSPWARIIRVNAPWKTTKVHDSDDPVSGLKNGQGSNSSGDDDADQGGTPQATFIVRWVSSRTIREAALRGALLNNQMKQEDLEKQLTQPVDTYQVMLAGPDMKPFEAVDEMMLKNNTTLVGKKTKQKLTPSNVQIQRGQDGKKIQAILFIFPKKSENGEATIAADEKGIDFSCAVGNVKIQAAFDISKMQDTQGQDL